MKRTIAKFCLIGMFASLLANVGFAQPSNTVSLTVTNPADAIWDFSLLTNELQNIYMDIVSHSEEVIAQYADPFAQDDKGKLSGSGPTTVTLLVQGSGGTNSVDAIYTVKGSVTSSKGVAHLTFSSKATGKTVIGVGNKAPAERVVTVSENLTVSFDANTGAVSGRASEHASAAGLGAVSQSSTISDTIPAGELGDGGWTLTLNFDQTTGNQLTGNATVTLDSGAVYTFTLKGTTNSKGQSNITLKSAGGAELVVHMSDASTISSVTGHVAGQSVMLKM